MFNNYPKNIFPKKKNMYPKITRIIQSTICRLLAVSLCLLFSGCQNLKLIAKVEPWERGNLAKDVMIREASDHQAALESHVYASKEGTMGGFGVGGGGCGCN